MDTLVRESSAESTAQAWLSDLSAAFASADVAALAALFGGECFWRDILAFTWDLHTTSGARAIAERIVPTLAAMQPRNLRLASGRTPPRIVTRAGTTCLEAIITFETSVGPCSGVVRLVTEGGRPRAWSLSTVLDEIRGHEDVANGKRWQNVDWKRNFGGENWADRRRQAAAYADRDPAVLVVGAAQAGLMAAARLSMLGVDTLVIDREQRLGDRGGGATTRSRCTTRPGSITSRTCRSRARGRCSFPDMLANWFELYAEAMELNVWTGTELVSADYDEAARRWTVTMKRADGSERVMRPRHVVFCNGVSTIPKWPTLPGLDSFAGTVRHSGDYGSGLDWTGKRALVLGTGTSGHDVAQDLAVSGAEVSIIQHGATLVVSLKEAQAPYALYDEDISFEDCDLIAVSSPYPVYERAHQQITKNNAEADRALLDGLRKRGFRLTSGPRGTGWQIMYQNRGGGYYFDAGCSQMIVDGRVGFIRFDDIERFCPEGARMRDGTIHPADLIVLATGYLGQKEAVRPILGDAITERIGPVWGFDEEGELAGMWRPTGQPGLWFLAGGLAQCRIFSKVLALQIKARELGITA